MESESILDCCISFAFIYVLYRNVPAILWLRTLVLLHYLIMRFKSITRGSNEGIISRLRYIFISELCLELVDVTEKSRNRYWAVVCLLSLYRACVEIFLSFYGLGP